MAESLGTVRCTRICHPLLEALSVSGALALSGCGPAAPCQGIKLGASMRPNLTIRGTFEGLSGSFRRTDHRDICATYGPPRSIRNLPRGEQAWAYGPGIAVTNVRGIPRRRFRHSSGRVILRRGIVVRIEMSAEGPSAPIGG